MDVETRSLYDVKYKSNCLSFAASLTGLSSILACRMMLIVPMGFEILPSSNPLRTLAKMTSSLKQTSMDDRREMFLNRLLYVAVLVWTFLGMCFPMYDTDFWWHLKTGERILSGDGIPYIDLFTFTDADKPWIDMHWGFQVLVAVLYRLGGVPLVTLVKSAIITGAVAIGWRATGPDLPSWKKALLWILPIICISGRGNERPEMLTQLFLALWLWIARKTDQRPNLIWFLPLVQVVWVNCHALFVLGLVVGFCYTVDALVRDWLNGQLGLARRMTGPTFRTIWIVGGLVAAACFINPYFEEGVLFPLTLYRKFSIEKDFYSKNIGEFQPPIDFVLRSGFSNIYLISELGVWLITAASFIWLLAMKRRWSLFRLLMFAGFSHLAWQATRNTNIFALVSGFIACENFADVQSSDSEPAAAGRTSVAYLPTIAVTAMIAGLCLAVVTGLWNQIGEKNKPFALGEAPNWFIHDAARFAGQPQFPMRAFVANIGQAEVYVYHNGPERKVFMDARLEVCTRETFERLNKILYAMSKGSDSWESFFREGGLPVVILDSRTTRTSINGMMRLRTWRLVFADRSAAVFLPVGLADHLKLPMADPTPLIYPDGPPQRSPNNAPLTNDKNTQ